MKRLLNNLHWIPLIIVFACSSAEETSNELSVETVDRPTNTGDNSYYVNNEKPLKSQFFIKLPIQDIKPGGWLKRSLELQKEGLTGNLGEISIWLTKENNAWLNKSGKGDFGWEEVPYWLRGYQRIAYILEDPEMKEEANIWIEGTMNSQRDNGDFGPIVEHNGKRDLWAQMLMLQVLQAYHEYTKDETVLPFMTSYFEWQNTIPDSLFLEDYWENSRGGDNLASVYWLYNRTGDKFLLDLATKIDRNTADWRQKENLPNWHVVNIAECFRQPATYYLQSGLASDLEASYNNFEFVREKYGQVPGGMFGADENAREGFDDPRQASETCSFVEQIASNSAMLRISGDPLWAANSEDVAFNSMPAAFTPDYKALRYLTAPNMVISDGKNHAPGIANEGPFLMMNPFSSRCCQHNHTSGWVNYAESTYAATQDNGLAAILYCESEVRAKVGDGTEIQLIQKTKYPFEEEINFTLKMPKAVSFPLYLRIPNWSKSIDIKINGEEIKTNVKPGAYVRLQNTWKDGDKVTLALPMEIEVREWKDNKNSISVNYGPITYSLKIEENYVQKDSEKTAIWDSKWQEGADAEAWPSYEIHPESPWNYGLVLDQENPESSFEVVKKSWPDDDYPFTNDNAPIELKAKGKRIPSWKIDQYGLVAVLPQSPVETNQPVEEITLVPMGGARLRISAFPQVE